MCVVVMSVTCVVTVWVLRVVLYVLWVFCVCDCDTCLAVFERLCLFSMSLGVCSM